MLLDRLSLVDDVRCGLVTGNFAHPAQIKLRHFDLWRFFHFGAYGDDAPVRDELVSIAIERAELGGVTVEAAHHVVVIGDTPLDVQCAVAAGARSVAVATGAYDVAALQRTRADAVVPDFRETNAVLELLLDI